ncbi:hypothetical protein ACFL0X_01420 [Nanoarchaeota archaeon]
MIEVRERSKDELERFTSEFKRRYPQGISERSFKGVLRLLCGKKSRDECSYESEGDCPIFHKSCLEYLGLEEQSAFGGVVYRPKRDKPSE